MSWTRAEFRFADGKVLHGWYNGTSDIMQPRMVETLEEVERYWRGATWAEHCQCSDLEPCIAVSYYGGGFYWGGLACRKHMVFFGPLDPFDENVIMVDGTELMTPQQFGFEGL